MKTNLISVADYYALAEKAKIHTIDVREKIEILSGKIPGALNIPYSTFQDNFQKQLNKNIHYYIACNHGYRAGEITRFLTKNGYQATSIKNGTAEYGQFFKLQR